MGSKSAVEKTQDKVLEQRLFTLQFFIIKNEPIAKDRPEIFRKIEKDRVRER